ncbi:hypothetical protein BDP55DRAFT_712639 [Colletotrichum godetiae]|uniref:Uncharacterized protein n=1 Tax=Colletotrichum godetiae TaxID=1209918 RepID=A0AAJ0ASG1_9PEZI|nr:uncharacterized protein BDP55DRAFT_712639 [Colletotrichum godetiae]KAK1689534.1 hypothetical protein BDP55DRAFT_712639 [Colletotrichum godetiae]
MAPQGSPGESSRKRSRSPEFNDWEGRYNLRSKVKVKDEWGFLALPQEVRNMVYGLAFVQIRITVYWDSRTKRCRQRSDLSGSSSLLHTCKTTYAEARAMLDYSATFEIEDMEYLEMWLKKIGMRVLNLRVIKLTRSFQAAFVRKLGIENFRVLKQREYRAISRRVAQLLSGCQHLESLDLGYLYTTKYQKTTLIEYKDNPRDWKVQVRLLTEMVFEDMLLLLAGVKSFGKTLDQVVNLLEIHPKNFESITKYYHLNNRMPEREAARHMRVLARKFIGI